MKSFAITLLTWAVLFAVLWYGAHELFYPPADWIAALVVSFLGACGIGGLRKARLERKDARIVARTKHGPVDGVRTAVVGTLEPVDAVLNAPLSGEPCLIYDYEIFHSPPRKSGDNTTPQQIIDRGGMAMAPCHIKTETREVRLLAWPGIEDFEHPELPDDVVERARSYISRTRFEDQSILEAMKHIGKLLDDRSGSIRADFKNTDYDDLDDSGFRERRIPVGANVCVVGLYSEKESAILPQDNVGGVRLINGTRSDALKYLQASRFTYVFFATLFLVIPGPIAYGILTLRENYNADHGLPTAWSARVEAFHKAAATGDADAVRSALRRVDVNDAGMSGNRMPALSHASNVEVARVLVEAGAKLEQRDKYGFTPVMRHASEGRVEIVRLLMSKGADVSTPTEYTGMNALDAAIDGRQAAVVNLLREAGVEERRK